MKRTLCLGFLLPALMLAQVETAGIIGHVKDQSGAVIPGAAITNTATRISVSTKAQESPPLQLASYKVSAERAGFNRAVRDVIVLRVEQAALLDIVMDIGQITQEDLSLNGRDYIQLGVLSGGTDPSANEARTGGFSASRMRSTQNNYLLDGVNNYDVQIAYPGRQG